MHCVRLKQVLLLTFALLFGALCCSQDSFTCRLWMQRSEEEQFYDSLEVAPEGEDFEDWLSGNIEDQGLDSSEEGEWDNYQEEPSFLTL